MPGVLTRRWLPLQSPPPGPTVPVQRVAPMPRCTAPTGRSSSPEDMLLNEDSERDSDSESDSAAASAVAIATANANAKPRVSFTVKYDCSDLAFCDDGTIVFAAVKKGVLRYKPTGERLSSWKPPKYHQDHRDSVMCLAPLLTKFLAVGLFHSRQVVILEGVTVSSDDVEARGNWIVRQVIFLDARPHRLATCGDMLTAVCSTPASADATLNIVPVHDVKLAREWQLRYQPSSVSMAPDTIIAASRSPFVILQAGSSETFYVVDGYSYSGILIWRMLHQSEIPSVCWSVCTRILYTLVPSYRSLVMAAGLDRQVGQVTQGRAIVGMQQKPLRAALFDQENGRPTVMAILMSDLRTVELY